MSYTNQKQGIGSLQLDESEYLASCLDIFSQPKIETQLIRGKDIIVGTLNSVQDVGASWCTGLGLGRLTADDCASRGGHSGGAGHRPPLRL